MPKFTLRLYLNNINKSEKMKHKQTPFAIIYLNYERNKPIYAYYKE